MGWRDDVNGVGVLGHMLTFGILTFVVGLMGLFGAFGMSISIRAVAALVCLVGCLLFGLSLRRLRRNGWRTSRQIQSQRTRPDRRR